MKHPIEFRKNAVKLRLKGYSVREIAKKLDISRSTSSLWVRNIELNEKAQKRLKKNRLLGYQKASLTWEKRRRKKQQRYKIIADRFIKSIKKDSAHTKLYCALLYWCEGSKAIGQNQAFRFTNSDPEMIRTFLTLLRKSFKINEKKLHVLMQLHSYHSEEEQKDYWSRLTRIPKNQFHKTFQKSNKKKRTREHYPGCITIYYNHSDTAQEIQTIYESFSRSMGV